MEKYKECETEIKSDTNTDVEFYLVDAFEIFHFEPFYIELRKKNINAVFIAEPWETNTSGKWFDYDSAIKILDEKGYVYHKFVNVNCKCAITTQQKDILKKYTNAKKIQLIYGIGFLKKVQFQLKDFLKTHGLRYDYLLCDMPMGERILVNDDKPSGLKTAYAVSKKRDEPLNIDFVINESL